VLDVPLLDKPPALTLPPPETVPLPEGEAGKTPPATPPRHPCRLRCRPQRKARPQARPARAGDSSSTGLNSQTRHWFNRFCETLAGDLQRLLRDPQPQAIPVVLSLRSGNDLSLSEPSVKAVVSRP